MASRKPSPSSQAILDKLDNLLEDCTPLEVEESHGVYYTKGLSELKKAQEAHVNTLHRVVGEKACGLVKSYTTTAMTDSFRILSIGCGNGRFDTNVLRAITEKFPEVKVHYIGIDIDQQTCQKAKETVSMLKNDNITVETFIADFEKVKIDLLKEKIPPCDLVIASHVFYYMKDIKKALSDARALRKNEGSIFICLNSSQSPKVQLCHRFFLHERKWPMKLDDSVMESLSELGIPYKVESIAGEIDFTESFKDNFQKPDQKFLLDFLAHTQLIRYPPEIAKLCIDFIASVAIGKPDQYIMPFDLAFITC